MEENAKIALIGSLRGVADDIENDRVIVDSWEISRDFNSKDKLSVTTIRLPDEPTARAV